MWTPGRQLHWCRIYEYYVVVEINIVSISYIFRALFSFVLNFGLFRVGDFGTLQSQLVTNSNRAISLASKKTSRLHTRIQARTSRKVPFRRWVGKNASLSLTSKMYPCTSIGSGMSGCPFQLLTTYSQKKEHVINDPISIWQAWSLRKVDTIHMILFRKNFPQHHSEFKIPLPPNLSMFRPCWGSCIGSGVLLLLLPSVAEDRLQSYTQENWLSRGRVAHRSRPLQKVDVDVLSQKESCKFYRTAWIPWFSVQLIDILLKSGMFCSYGSGDLWSLQFQTFWLYYWRPTLLQSTKKIVSSWLYFIYDISLFCSDKHSSLRFHFFLGQTCSSDINC